MLSAARRRAAVPVAAFALGLVLTACGGEVREQTQQWRDPGGSGAAGDIAIRNTVVVADDDGQQATLIAALANEGGADELVQVRLAGGQAEPEGGPMPIPARGYANLGPDQTRLDVTGAGVLPGQFVEVEFIFAAAPRTTVDALVRSDDGVYAGALD